MSRNSKISHDIMLIPLSYNFPPAYNQPNALTIGREKDSHDFYQTNEAPTFYIEKYLQGLAPARTLKKIYLIASRKTREEIIRDGKNTARLYQEHITAILPQLGDCFEIIEYDETAAEKNLEKSVLQISEIADLIRRDFPADTLSTDNHIAIHADMSGGVRDLALVVLNTIQLLTLSRKSRFVSGKIVYANLKKDKNEILIDDATEIYQTTRLIAGAYEFIESGSVNQLTEFFKQKLSELNQAQARDEDLINYIQAVTRLLAAMREYSDTILVCGRFYLDEAKAKLKKAIARFDKEIDGCNLVIISMFKKLKHDILTEYNDLLKDDSTVLDTIRWCTDRHYLQQALTFCTEQTPRLFITSGLVVPLDDQVRADLAASYREYLILTHRENERDEAATPENDDELAKYFLSDYLKKYAAKNRPDNESDDESKANNAGATINQGINKIFSSSADPERLASLYAKYIDLQRKRNNISHAKKERIKIRDLPDDILNYIDTLGTTLQHKYMTEKPPANSSAIK